MQTIHRLHISDLHSFKICPRKFYYGKILRRKPSNYDTPRYFVEGTLFHRKMEEFYTGKEVTQEELLTYPKQVTDLVIPAFEKYCKVYADDKDRFETLSCETTVEAPIGNQNLRFTVDLKVMHRETAKLQIWDHKFYAQSTFNSVNPDSLYCLNQAWGYFWLLDEFLGQHIDTFVLNTIRKTLYEDIIPVVGINKKTPLGTPTRDRRKLEKFSYDGYVRQIEACGLSVDDFSIELELIKSYDKSGFYRHQLARNEKRVEYERAHILDLVKLLDSVDGDSPDDFPLNFGYGCDKCPYFRLCQKQIEGKNPLDYLPFYTVEKEDDER